MSAVERTRSRANGVARMPEERVRSLLFCWYLKVGESLRREVLPAFWAAMYVEAEARRASRVHIADEELIRADRIAAKVARVKSDAMTRGR